MKRNFWWSIPLLIMHLCISEARCQDNKPVKIMPLSPNAASLGKYGDYTVNLFHGLPEISIPIYTAKSGELELPITLSYHAGGHKYLDKASWVGLGWSLNTGGTVSRNTRGFSDESDGGFLTNNFLYNSANPLSFTSAELCRDFWSILAVSEGGKDMEQDIFNFSLPGGNSGKFLLNRGNLAPTQIPLSAVNINYTIANKSITNFTIRNDNGTKFIYGNIVNEDLAIEESNSNNSSWLLNTIESPLTKDKISVKYKQGTIIPYNDFSESVVVTDNILNNYECKGDLSCIKHHANPGVPHKHYNSNNVSQRLPQQILFDNGKVEFISKYVENGYQLEQINIYSLNNDQYKIVNSYKFVYSYFTDLQGKVLRLKLDKLLKINMNNAVEEKYEFDYFTNTFSWDMPTGSLSRDYWGYFNGKSNTSLIPRIQVPYNISGTDTNSFIYVGNSTFDGKDANPTYMKEGVLKRITFPTQGFTEFDYEINKYKETNGDTLKAGGLRIKQISSFYDPVKAPVIKTYKYGKHEDGFGKRNFSKEQYGHYITSVTEFDRNIATGDGGSERRTTVSSNPTAERDPWDGATVVYPYVTEYLGKGNDHIGKTVYIFDEGAPREDIIRPVTGGLLYKESYHWQRGALTEKRIFDKSGSLLAKTVNTYTVMSQKFQDAGFKVILVTIANHPQKQFCSADLFDTNNKDYRFGTYSSITGVYKLTETKEYNFKLGDTLKYNLSYKKFKYNTSNWQVSETTESSSFPGEEIVTKTKYPLDYGTPSSLTGAMKNLYDRNMQNKVVEKYSFKQNIDGTGKKLISGMFINYKGGLNQNVIPVIDTVYELESPVIALSNFTPSSLISGIVKKDQKYKPKLKYLKYNSEGNVEEYARMESGSVVNNTRTSYIWGYYKTMPIAEVINASSDQVAYTSFETANQGSFLDENGGWTVAGVTYLDTDYKTGLRCVSSPAATIGFNLKKSGLPSESYTVSLWANGTGTIVVNGSSKAIKAGWNYYEWNIATATEVTVLNNGNKIDEARLFPTKSRMSTYSYNMLRGINEVIDQNNRINAFDYDSYGRLKAIKDFDLNVLKAYEYNYMVK